ncbi:hypothetical protein LAUMK35_05247 [Mycobacterium pseudokansasii]|nr:hypothetical protein LAUMK35_05247 [Mycobacterium pseudokansasii]VBA34151.1 hypothetical protein LAUMK21_05205 [Mycobacterium pseudokansasii]
MLICTWIALFTMRPLEAATITRSASRDSPLGPTALRDAGTSWRSPGRAAFNCDTVRFCRPCRGCSDTSRDVMTHREVSDVEFDRGARDPGFGRNGSGRYRYDAHRRGYVRSGPYYGDLGGGRGRGLGRDCGIVFRPRADLPGGERAGCRVSPAVPAGVDRGRGGLCRCRGGQRFAPGTTACRCQRAGPGADRASADRQRRQRCPGHRGQRGAGRLVAR